MSQNLHPKMANFWYKTVNNSQIRRDTIAVPICLASTAILPFIYKEIGVV